MVPGTTFLKYRFKRHQCVKLWKENRILAEKVTLIALFRGGKPVKVYTISQVADLVGVSATTVRNAVQAGKLKASKERGKYQVTLEALDAWVASRQGNENGKASGQQDNPCEQDDRGEQSGLIPWNYVRGVQDKLYGAVYRAGQAEARACLLSEELSRLRCEKDREREKYEARIRDLENQLREQQQYIIERLEAREKAILEFITAWRESAATSDRKKKKPWWKIWGSGFTI